MDLPLRFGATTDALVMAERDNNDSITARRKIGTLLLI